MLTHMPPNTKILENRQQDTMKMLPATYIGICYNLKPYVTELSSIRTLGLILLIKLGLVKLWNDAETVQGV